MGNHGGKRSGTGGPKGRRPKTATCVIQIRVSPKEKQCIEDRAARRKMTRTEFIKICTLTGTDDVCVWTLSMYGNDLRVTSCRGYSGSRNGEGDDYDGDMRICPYCGKPIKAVD